MFDILIVSRSACLSVWISRLSPLLVLFYELCLGRMGGAVNVICLLGCAGRAGYVLFLLAFLFIHISTDGGGVAASCVIREMGCGYLIREPGGEIWI